MSRLKVVVTSGNTKEYIDDVRVLTNISTGKLGAKIAQVFIEHGHEVTYVAPVSAEHPSGDRYCNHYNNVNVTNVQSVMEVMKNLVPKSDVVIQTMAIGDFTFDLTTPVKISSESPEAFVEHIKKTIRLTPKVISNYRGWNPNAILVGFKFTVGKSSKECDAIARELMKKNDLDMVFANDKKKMQDAKDHVGTLIMKDWEEQYYNKDEIAQGIYDNVIRLVK